MTALALSPVDQTSTTKANRTAALPTSETAWPDQTSMSGPRPVKRPGLVSVGVAVTALPPGRSRAVRAPAS
ncbi:hypothetical protein GCM10010521_37180 [Streptomyces rameus]|uniref:Uncharacterized protein n=1 Tax=Streptomyces rameus TaxID=68261 RepID=A0ABP6NFL6_9ACTN